MLKFLKSLSSSNKQKTRVDYDAALARGNLLLADGNFFGAAQNYEDAIALSPTDHSAHFRLGYVLFEAGVLDQAREALEKSISLASTHADSHYFLGKIAAAHLDFSKAALQLIAALQINPLLEPAYTEAAQCLFRLGKVDQALDLISEGIAKLPERPHLIFCRGNLLAESGRHEEAALAYRKTLTLAPDLPEALANLGNCERHLGNLSSALDLLKQARSLQPLNAAWHSDFLLTLQYSGMADRQALYEEHLLYAAAFETREIPHWPEIPNRPLTRRKLKIGYVSGDFRNHSLAFFIEPVLRHHDKENVEIHCYYNYPICDDVTSRLKSLADFWTQVSDLSDSELAQKIQDDQIDVLIDLSGHTGHNRLLTFARKPARVQMTWLGYQATTGLSAIDYRITDAGIDPPGKTERFFSEKLLRLSSGAVFQPDASSPEVNCLPALTTGIFTFACLNNPAKLTPAFAKAAAEILLRTANTRLLIGNVNKTNAEHVLGMFTSYGAPSNRIDLQEKTSLSEYLRLHGEIDMALDTFPYNGGTTTFHSIWMGVPVLSIEGDMPVGRVGAQTMRGLGFGEFACADLQTYIDKAVNFSKNLDVVQRVRASLRPALEETLVKSSVSFTRELEQQLYTTFENSEIST